MSGSPANRVSGSGSRSPRVLVLGPLRPPHISDQALALAERGFDLHVAGNAPPGHTNSVIEEAGIPVTEMPQFRRSRPAGMAAMVRWTRELIARVEPDVVQAHWVPGYGLAAALAGAERLAVSAWGSDVYGVGGLQRLANRWVLRRAGLVMADSEDLLDRCRELGAPGDRCEIVQWGVDLERFSPAADGERSALKAELGLGDAPLILSTRSLYPVYNIDVIVEAFDRVGAEHPDARLLIKHMGTVMIELGELPHPDRVKVIDRVPYEQLADYYRAADVCVSVTSSDSSPRSVWEAMASGCPCVLTDLPWVDELVRPAEAAELVAVRDPEGTAAAISRVLGDSEWARRLAARGRELVTSELDRSKHMDRLAQLLERVPAR